METNPKIIGGDKVGAFNTVASELGGKPLNLPVVFELVSFNLRNPAFFVRRLES
jgi:hypothetical protein